MQPAWEYISQLPVRTKSEYPYSYDPIRHFHTQAHGDVETCYSDRMATWDYGKYRACVLTMAERYKPYVWRLESATQAQEFLRLYYGAPELVLLDLVEWCNVATGYTLYSFAFIRVPDASKPLSAALKQVPKSTHSTRRAIDSNVGYKHVDWADYNL